MTATLKITADPRAVSIAEAIAAELVADDSPTDRRIAEQLGIHVATLERRKRRPGFVARVEEHLAAYREELSREAAV